ncbi:hypothetical protein X943_002095 [Babesia divergens]|uniref:Uncharacterized protein n=1 Tax=Babesia divergens TaxID=32595 RepID=A0AAD9GFU8_BABDI|nr:hypothetical protein X943_002095 [Babesia divergens]
MDKRDRMEAASSPQGPSRGSGRPTLFNLLEVLASDAYTTPQQRHSIRGVVTEFLNNKFEHAKVYSYIGTIVGHDVLHSVIKQLEANPDRVPLPDQNGLMRIESAFNLSRSYKPPMQTDATPSVSSTQAAPVMQPNVPVNAAFNVGSKEDILRSIRRNLGSKKSPSNSSQSKDTLSTARAASAGVLLQKACWMPIRRSLSAGALYGHSLICIGSRAYLLGGSSGHSQGSNLAKAHVISLVNFSSKQITFTGDIPSRREGNSSNVAVLQQSHCVIIFGGFNGERFFNDIHILDLEKRKWVHRRHAAGRVPLPRDEHSALIYPARCESAQKPKCGAEYLFIFAGKTGIRSKLECLNDMWAYHIESATWAQVELPADCRQPAPRFGVCALWADDDTICVFGGETHNSEGVVDRTQRCLLDDLWMFRLSAPLSGSWHQEIYEGSIGPRSHYSSIFIAQRCKELHTGVPRTIERLMLLTGGLTYAPGSRKSVVASDKLYFYFFSQRRWYILKPNYPRNYVGEPFEPRQLHVACFFEKRNILFPGTKPSVPCIFFHGGFHRKQVLSDAWVLSLTGEDLFLKNSVISPADSNQMKPMQTKAHIYPRWFYRESHSPDLLWALSSMQRWIFGAIAHLVANSIKEVTGSTKVTIKWEMSPNGERALLSVQDDGNGLDFTAMNKVLKLFGQSKTGERGPSYEYGVGFKMAFARLASSCAVMSRTNDSIGIGMLSVELMSQCESREMAAPLCMWRLPSKELINKDGSRMIDQRHHQRLLMSYSPFNSATLLAEQINLLGTAPGTRILFWQMRDDLDCIWYSAEDNTLLLKNHLYDGLDETGEKLTVESPNTSPVWLNTFPLYSSSKFSMDYCLPVYLYWLHLRSSCLVTVQDIDLTPHDMRNRIAQESVESDDTNAVAMVEYDSVVLDQQQPENSPNKDVYNCQRNGCSYCGVASVERSLGEDRRLWSFLMRRLYCKVQLPFLFSPSDHQYGSYALIGFLNRPAFCTAADDEEVTCDYTKEIVCETGVLLYFKDRLISRLEGHFPAPTSELDGSKAPMKPSLLNGELYRFALTAVVNVPDWLLPSASKQEFVQENNKAFFDFKAKLMALISEYCKVCHNYRLRKEWEAQRMQQLVLYDQEQEQMRIKLSHSDSAEEMLPTWQSEGNRPATVNSTPDMASQISQEASSAFEQLQ